SPIYQYVPINSGSDLPWTQCQPYSNCYHQGLRHGDGYRLKGKRVALLGLLIHNPRTKHSIMLDFQSKWRIHMFIVLPSHHLCFSILTLVRATFAFNDTCPDTAAGDLSIIGNIALQRIQITIDSRSGRIGFGLKFVPPQSPTGIESEMRVGARIIL
ncbi:hypothetical protein Tsubulata_007983, partial [Turnera subulata]